MKSSSKSGLNYSGLKGILSGWNKSQRLHWVGVLSEGLAPDILKKDGLENDLEEYTNRATLEYNVPPLTEYSPPLPLPGGRFPSGNDPKLPACPRAKRIVPRAHIYWLVYELTQSVFALFHLDRNNTTQLPVWVDQGFVAPVQSSGRVGVA